MDTILYLDLGYEHRQKTLTALMTCLPLDKARPSIDAATYVNTSIFQIFGNCYSKYYFIIYLVKNSY